MWRALWLLLLLLALALPVQADPFATSSIVDARADACDYEDLTTGEAARLPVVVDLVRGAAPDYRVCKFNVAHWAFGSMHTTRMRAVDTMTGEVSTWFAATLDKPDAASPINVALVGTAATPPPPPEPTVISRFGGGTATFNPSASENIAWPASVTADHVAVLVLSYFNGTSSGPQARNVPAGFTLRGTTVIDTYLTYSSVVDVFTRDLDGTETGNINVSFAGNVYGHAALTVLEGDGALTFAGISAADNGSGTDATAPSVSGTAGQGLVAAFGTGDPPGTTNSGPSGFTLGDDATADTNGARVYFKTLSSTGATGTATWDFTNSREWAGFSILIDDAGSGGGGTSLVINDSTHAHAADAPTLSTSLALTIANASHAHAADNLSLSSNAVLSVASASHGHAAENVSLTSNTALTIAAAEHAHSADNLALSSGTALAAADALHAQPVDSIVLSTDAYLAVADALHAHAADNVVLSTALALAIADVVHAHAADNVGLSSTGSTNLSVNDAAHAHTVDNAALTAQLALAIQDALHAHSAEGLSLSAAVLLVAQDALHAHSVDNLGLSSAPFLQITDALHAHVADAAALSVDAWLAIANAAHGHTADQAVLSLIAALAIADALHAHSADDVLLNTDPVLVGPIKWVRLRSPMSAGVVLASRMPAGLRLRSIIDVEE